VGSAIAASFAAAERGLFDASGGSEELDKHLRPLSGAKFAPAQRSGGTLSS
jgi:hypothetical protein